MDVRHMAFDFRPADGVHDGSLGFNQGQHILEPFLERHLFLSQKLGLDTSGVVAKRAGFPDHNES